MKILIAGATGALGRRIVPALRAAGHDVVGITRTESGVAALAALGAQAVVADVLDREALLRGVDGIRADAVLHELTVLKKVPIRFSGMAQTNRLRREGSTNLLEAAREVGATRYVTQSIVFGYGYAALGDVDEDSPFGVLAGDATDDAVAAMASAEQQAFEAPGIDGIALRYGLLYGDDSATMARMLDRRSLPVPTRWRGAVPLVHHRDAAAATVAALEHGLADRAYNVVDDHPVSWREYIEAVAQATGAKRPMALPSWMLRLAAPYAAAIMTRVDLRASNQRARRELGWQPEYPSVRDGLRAS